MSTFQNSTASRVKNKTHKPGFWELLSDGVISVDNQRLEDIQTLSGLKNMDSRMLSRRIDNFCSSNNIREIPTLLKAKAIRCLESRFTQINCGKSENEISTYLKAMFPKERSETMSKTFAGYQQEFIQSVKTEISDEIKDRNLLNAENSRTDELVLKLSLQRILRADDTHQMKLLAIQLYYLYLSKYQDFLDTHIKMAGRKSDRQKGRTGETDLRAARYSEQVQDCLNSFLDDIAQRRISNYPESTYELVVKCSRKLDRIKSELGIHHELYTGALGNLIHVATRTILEMVENPVRELLLADISELKLGKNLLEECETVFEKINLIEMDSYNHHGFEARKGYFRILKQQVLSKTNASMLFA
jgi:hypothetical protein